MNLSKKCLVFIFLMVSVSAFLSAVEAEAKVSDLNNDGYAYRYRYFNGFNFGSYEPSSIGLIDIVKKEYEKIKTDDAATGFTEEYAIVGHSQGGARVLGYATYLKQQDPAQYNRLQAVITMSGIDKGLKALDGGVGMIRAKLLTDVGTIYNGLVGLVNVLNVCPLLTPAMLISTMGRGGSIVREWLMNGIVDILPDEMKAYVKPALSPTVNLNTMGEIRDMIPRSNYLETYVSSSQRYTYKVKTGERTVWKWAKGWLGIWYPYLGKEDVYTIYTGYSDTPKFGNEMPVGYLVGLNSNTLSMVAKDVKLDLFKMMGLPGSATVTINPEKIIRESCDNMATVFDVAGAAHIAKCVCVIGLFTGSLTSANYCFNASDWFDDIDGQLNELKGSSENDGLVAKESQFYPKTFKDPNSGVVRNVHTNVICSDPVGYKGFKNHNHESIRYGANDDVKLEIREMLYQAQWKRTGN